MEEKPYAVGDNNIESLGILELFGKETLENLQKAIAKVTGLGVITADYKGEPLTEMTSFTPFCQCVRKRSIQERICNLSDAFGITQSAVLQKYCIYCCPCGLMEVAIPIIINNQFLGGFLAGQVKCPDVPDDVPKFSGFLKGIEMDREDAKTKELFDEIPTYDYKKFEDMAELIFLIVNLLAEKTMAKMQEMKQQGKENEVLKSEITELKYQIQLLEKENKRYKISLNPFLFLNMMTNLVNLSVIEDAPKTNEIAIAFSEYLKYNMEQRSEAVNFLMEIENVERYLQIFQTRYPGFHYSVKIKKEMEMQRIPSHILLPHVQKLLMPLILGNKEYLMLEVSAKYQGEDFCINLDIKCEGKKTEPYVFPGNTEITYMEEAALNAAEKMKVMFGKNFKISEHIYNDDEKNISICFPRSFRERVV